MEDTKQMDLHVQDFVWKVQNRENSKTLYGRHKKDRALRLCTEGTKQTEL